MAMARQFHRYLHEYREDVSVPEGMHVSPRALFQKMVMAMIRRRVRVPTQEDAAMLRGVAAIVDMGVESIH